MKLIYYLKHISFKQNVTRVNINITVTLDNLVTRNTCDVQAIYTDVRVYPSKLDVYRVNC